MLVPSMSLEEIRREIHKDIIIVYRKVRYTVLDLKKANKPLGNRRIVRLLPYRSTQKNTWLIKIEIDKQGTMLSFLVYYYTNNGLAAIEVFFNSAMMMYFTTHFFKRYNERLKLNCKTPEELLHTFMNNHYSYRVQKLEQLDAGVHKIFAVTEKGVGLGTQLTDRNFIKMNTFITNDMLLGTQVELQARLKGELDKYLSSVHRLD